MSEPADLADLDLERLRSFTGGDEVIEREILDLFLLGADGYMLALGASSPGTAAWRQAAHALKGSAQGVGAERIAAWAGRLESLEAQAGPSAVTTGLGELQKMIRQVGEQIRRHYP